MTSQEDELAIRRLHEEYCAGVFQSDSLLWSSTWAEDGVWNLMGNEIQGRDTLRAVWEQAMKDFAFVGFMYQLGTLQIDGTKGAGLNYIQETLTDQDNKTRIVFGEYQDQYTKEQDGWKFSRREYKILREFKLGDVS